jgi:mono/diheme cytochrome c family protein
MKTPPDSMHRHGLARRVDVVAYTCAWSKICILAALFIAVPPDSHAADRIADQFVQKIQPILEDHCYACHGNGLKKGGVILDSFTANQARLGDREFWWRVLKNVRAGIMPPAGEPQLSVEQRRLLDDWIKHDSFGIDPKNPNPGRVIVRRLNRVEYRNTIRALLDVDYDTEAEFPPDDTGHGFDNIGEVLTISPLLLEKYIAAAKTVVAAAVPTSSKTVAEHTITGRRFRGERAPLAAANDDGPLSLSYYQPAVVTSQVRVEHAGRYQVVIDLTASERFVDGVFDLNRCRLTFKVDGRQRLVREYSRQDGRAYRDVIDEIWQPGEHQLAVELQPLAPAEPQVRSLTIRLKSVTIRGPLEEEHWVRPRDYTRFFPKDVPLAAADRQLYAREILERFATRAFRRPVRDETVDRLVAFATGISAQAGQTFEAGIAQAMTAVLASPGFLFREESAVPGSSEPFPLVDENALASRLSYFLWSSMPDQDLIRLAGANKLRENLHAQVARMLADARSEEFVRHFVGQWLQARDIESVQINAFAVISRDQEPDPEAEKRRTRFRELSRKSSETLTDLEKKELEQIRGSFGGSFRRFREFELNGELRRTMRRETEMLFGYIVRNGRNVLELIDGNYTFLNERLARYYGIADVRGEEMRKVALPAGSPLGGVLTQATVLVVTSNPDRTSPVKRGLFLLDNVLGTPPAPPPPDIPPLEDAAKRSGNKKPTLRATLALHRQNPTCSSCHNQMDPLGLALENFNALGRWRDKEQGQPIDASGKLITGEKFGSIQELKQVIVTKRQRDFYRCLSEKLLTYALGRGLGYDDVETVDRLVERLERNNGNAADLVMGVVESVPFQRIRREQRTAVNEAAETTRRKPVAASGGSP